MKKLAFFFFIWFMACAAVGIGVSKCRADCDPAQFQNWTSMEDA